MANHRVAIANDNATTTAVEAGPDAKKKTPARSIHADSLILSLSHWKDTETFCVSIGKCKLEHYKEHY